MIEAAWHLFAAISSCLLTLLYFRRTLLPSASSGYTIGRLSFTQLLTSVSGIPISLYHFGLSSSHRFRGLSPGRFPTGSIRNVLHWGAVGANLLTCGHHLILFSYAVCSAGCMFPRRLIFRFWSCQFWSFLQLFWYSSSLLLSTFDFLWWWGSSFQSIK